MILDYPTIEEFGLGFLYLMLSIVPLSIAALLIPRFSLLVFLPSDDISVEEERLRRLRYQKWILRCTVPPTTILMAIAMIIILDYILGGFLAICFIGIGLSTFLPEKDTTNPFDRLMAILSELPNEQDVIRTNIQDFLMKSALPDNQQFRLLTYLLERDDVIGLVAAEMSTEIEVDRMYRNLEKG